MIGVLVLLGYCKASWEALPPFAEDPYTYKHAMESPQLDYQTSAMEDEITSIVLNDTFSTLN